MATAIELAGLMQDEQLDEVVGGCKKYDYEYYYAQGDEGGNGSSGRDVEINSIVVDDININADDGSQVFVTFLQET